MSPRPDRRGGALLAVVASLAVLALVVSALADGARAGTRAARLAAARAALDAHADRARDAALDAVRAGAWRTLAAGERRTLGGPGAGDTLVVATLARPAWDVVTLHVAASAAAGVRGVPARATRRLHLPLDLPWPMPGAPLVGVRAWDVAGTVTGHDDPADSTRRCADDAGTPVPVQRVRGAPPLAPLLAHPAARVVDPDTAADTLRGLVVLAPGTRVSRPLAVRGWLVAAGALEVAAPVAVTGLLVLARAADTRPGGTLQVEGAAWDLDPSASPRLAPGSRVHWAPCTLRGVRDALARPAPVATWGHDDGG